MVHGPCKGAAELSTRVKGTGGKTGERVQAEELTIRTGWGASGDSRPPEPHRLPLRRL